MISQTGVTPRTSPTWYSLGTGHDVPCSAYSYNEFMKILAWTKEEYWKQGLGIPKSFRAGGWFADVETLRALADSGFLIDSSGRDYYVWGKNRLQGHWNLKSTTRPYKPSLSNQNASTPAPNINIWEFPNNGADSYFNDQHELIKRFDENYERKPLTAAQVLTYLTHPHDFAADRAVLDPVFNHAGQYLAKNDQGPVIYVTLLDAYEDMGLTN
jgi:hypothetical protein